ncbi:MAG: TetR/AcrR family transcriptional regulator [Clostridiales bacterium]|nr:TetR/AcrR family transcriptional regulator [Clostridiales bacterium]
MYCGSNKTALASQRQIAEAMMVLIREKPYREITVSELCRQAGISRQTFYTLFTSRENVVVFTLQAQACDAPGAPRPGRPAEDAHGLRQLCRGYSEYIQRNSALIKLLVENRLDHLLYDSLCEALEACGCFLSGEDDCTRKYAASFYAGGVSCVARRYAQEGCTSTAKQLEALLAAMFSGKWY